MKIAQAANWFARILKATAAVSISFCLLFVSSLSTKRSSQALRPSSSRGPGGGARTRDRMSATVVSHNQPAKAIAAVRGWKQPCLMIVCSDVRFVPSPYQRDLRLSGLLLDRGVGGGGSKPR
ncbi:hypothetical protein PoB_003438900 [Plakobranchus ocellatus]|uniref:Carbonic anhydrase n=1 Tax=Plakobranchus ocellatus TaxID=259542 RepID=A0AAV4ANF9_9GAST|nr:hypothetical protein PoB_003438900 [Plakobranchus ocellatus]